MMAASRVSRKTMKKNGDGKHVMSHGGRRGKEQTVPGERVMRQGRQYKALTNR